MKLPPTPSLKSGWRSLIACMNRDAEYDDVLDTTTRCDEDRQAVHLAVVKIHRLRAYFVVLRSVWDHRRLGG